MGAGDVTAAPTVGIVMRTKDRPVMLARALRSVFDQSYDAWTLAIVNDGGDPSAIEELLGGVDADVRSRIGVVHHETSRGMQGASKSGLAALDTDLLIVHDDDDTWAPSFLEIAVAELRKIKTGYPETAGVVTYANLVKERVRGSLIEIDSVEPFNGWIPAGFLSFDRMLAGNVLPPISFLFERSALVELDETYEKIPYLGDWDFLIRFLAKHEVFVIPQFLAFYHWRPPEHASPYNNSVTAEIDRHRFFRQLLLNRWLREDLAAGRFGIGAYANLRAHFAIDDGPSDIPAPPIPAAPKLWDDTVSRVPDTARHRLAIVCPMANERETAARFVREVLDECEAFCDARMFVVLDRAGTDGTREILTEFAKTEPRLTVVWAPENRSVVDAYVRGYREALGGPFDWILEIDGGFSHQPKDIPRFFEAIERGDCDCAFGSRFAPGGRIVDSSLVRRLLSSFGTVVTNAVLGTKLADMTSGFQLFRREALAAIVDRGIASRGHFFQTEMKFRSRNMRTCEIPITYRAASPSVSRASIVDACTMLLKLRREKR